MAIRDLFTLNNRLSKGLLALVIVVIMGGLVFVQDQKIRKEAWQGVVVEKWEKKPRLRTSNPTTRHDYKRRNRYYWKVQRDDGSTAEYKIPQHLYTSANPGSRIQKIYGERYPKVMK